MNNLKYPFLPLVIEEFSYQNPCACFENFLQSEHAVFLDSSAGEHSSSRYSYIAADPFLVLKTQDHVDPFPALEAQLEKYHCSFENAPVPFAGGVVGYLSYELGGNFERLPKPKAERVSLPLMVMGFYDVVLAFDHKKHKAWVLSSGLPETNENLREKRAQERCAAAIAKLAKTSPLAPVTWHRTAPWRAELSKSEVERRIAAIIEYIHAGDVFQTNFTQRFLATLPEGLDAWMLYRRLRALNPAPFSAYLNLGQDNALLSASPERFLKLSENGEIEAQPIKGTTKRSKDPKEDALLATNLLKSAKDRAENLMIVDLMRNDLSRVAQLGSVKVPQLCALDSFASVHHLTSTVTATLQEGACALDLLRASFPGGSVTGAPKIRAMEIIHELEEAPRGAYCGCIGWIGYDGTMDMSMTIRTLSVLGRRVIAQAGGGIVADSEPSAEYEESMIKIMPLLRALEGPAP